MVDTPDGELLDRLANGERRALEQLYDRCARTAFALALRVTGEQSLAESAVTAAFVEAWRHPLHGSGVAIERWIRRLVHRHAVELSRRHPRREARLAALAVSGARAPVDDGRPGPDPLSQLAPGDRRALELAYYDGLLLGEVAETLAVERADVCHGLARSLRLLAASAGDRSGDDRP